VEPDKTLALDATIGRGVNTCTTLWASPPLKFEKATNGQKSMRFTITFEFERRYLRKR